VLYGALSIAGYVHAGWVANRSREFDAEFFGKKLATCGRGFPQCALAAACLVVSTVQ
jgi:hypothetical protein